MKTPGPWKLVKTNSGTICNDGSELVVYHDVKAACGNTVAAVYATYASEQNQTANAALISAAPELLAALEWAVQAADTEQYEACWYAAARAAIAKAGGVQ